MKKRSIVIKSNCGKCEELHEASGVAGIFAVLKNEDGDVPGRGYDIGTGVFSVRGKHELLALVLSLLQSLYKIDSVVVNKALAIFIEKAGIGMAINPTKLMRELRLKEASLGKKSKLAN